MVVSAVYVKLLYEAVRVAEQVFGCDVVGKPIAVVEHREVLSCWAGMAKATDASEAMVSSETAMLIDEEWHIEREHAMAYAGPLILLQEPSERAAFGATAGLTCQTNAVFGLVAASSVALANAMTSTLPCPRLVQELRRGSLVEA